MIWKLLPLFLLILTSCAEKSSPKPDGVDFRSEMRTLVAEISAYAKSSSNRFVVIPQNGHQLISGDANLWPDIKNVQNAYLTSIDGIGREDLFFGYDDDNVATPASETKEIVSYLNEYKAFGLPVLVTDYCTAPDKIASAKAANEEKGYLSFVAESRELDRLPSTDNPILASNSEDITDLTQAHNFLYLINPDRFSGKEKFIEELSKTNYDVLIIDAFYDEDALTAADVNALKIKANGGRRLVVAYMSIGEAEDYRYYWKRSWSVGNPDWLFAENKNWGGNYKVAYWKQSWKTIFFGESSSYLDKIIVVGFDGTYLDIIDAYEYFEEL